MADHQRRAGNLGVIDDAGFLELVSALADAQITLVYKRKIKDLHYRIRQAEVVRNQIKVELCKVQTGLLKKVKKADLIKAAKEECPEHEEEAEEQGYFTDVPAAFCLKKYKRLRCR